ncbi:MAG: beta-ketoacyl synthase [Gammaproteobacteria bacterium]|nr:beta-ketoacyl synthase [Gammaproteobacteria bacterium]
MTALPVIVGFGGYNASGRSSFHHGYRRTVLESLPQEQQVDTLLGLACLMKLVEHQDGRYVTPQGEALSADQVAEKYREQIEQGTLVRRIHKGLFDVDNVPSTRDLELQGVKDTEFVVRRRDLPAPLPANWQVETIDDKSVRVTVSGDMAIKMENLRELDVQSAGMVPTGFEPAEQYNSRFHPRGLQLAIIGASDAINSIGINWQDIMAHIDPDDVAVYASSGLGQTDDYGIGGYMQARLRSNRPTSKQMALGLNSMPADFVNAYVCGSVGTTGAMTGACASFLYNLRLAVDDIAAGRHRLVIAGCSEAPVTPEVIEGFAAMSALGTDERLAKLDNAEQADHRRASRPFGENAGFTMAESTQYFVLMDDALALELGAEIYGAVPHVFVNADGFKKSISSPGAGNYVTVAKAVGAASAIVGEEVVRERSFVHAHGSSTPQNRVTESIMFDRVAAAFGIKSWPVSAVKAFVGHPLGPASGDQLSNALGVFADGIIPGIKTTHAVADDVADEHLEILLKDKVAEMDVAFLNSKGFGGNNATATVLSPRIAEAMMAKRYGEAAWAEYQQRRVKVRERAQAYDRQAINGDLNIIYHFGEGMIDEAELEISADQLRLPEFSNPVPLKFDNPFADMV